MTVNITVVSAVSKKRCMPPVDGGTLAQW